MRKATTFAVVLLLLGFTTSHSAAPKDKQWAMNATVIEACTCPMFCQCYFATKPAAHHDHSESEHFCRFNNAYRINQGHYGDVKLDGAKFWVSGDLGGDFSQGQMDWAVLTFDRAMTKQQREAVGQILPHLFPVQWKSFQTAEGNIDTWKFDNDRAHATLDGGKTAEVRLVRQEGNANEPKPPVVQNLRYWGAPRNDGFVLMPNEVNAYRAGPKAYESRGTNGFMVTFDLNSQDVAATKAAMD